MLQASLGASIVSLGALLAACKNRRKRGNERCSSLSSSPASSQCASLWLKSLCGDNSPHGWLFEEEPALLVFQAQQLVRVSGPPSAPNSRATPQNKLQFDGSVVPWLHGGGETSSGKSIDRQQQSFDRGV